MIKRPLLHYLNSNIDFAVPDHVNDKNRQQKLLERDFKLLNKKYKSLTQKCKILDPLRPFGRRILK